MHLHDATCRICLGKQRLNSIFKKNLAKKIRYCASVQLSEDDELPKMICNQCLFYLDVAYIFRTVCEATDARLRKQLKERKHVGNIVIDSVKTIPVREVNIADHFYCVNKNDVNAAKEAPVAGKFYVIKTDNINGTATIKEQQIQNVCVGRGINGNNLISLKGVENIHINSENSPLKVENVHVTRTNSTKVSPIHVRKSEEFYIVSKNATFPPAKQMDDGINCTKQEGESFHIINVPIANEVVIGDEEPDSDVLSVTSSPAKYEKCAPETIGQKANQQKFGRHTAKKKSAKVAKRIIPAEDPVKGVSKTEDKVIVQIEPRISENNQNPADAKKVEEMKTENNEEKKTHQCDQCDKSFSYKCFLTRHMAVHSKENKYKCHQCNKTFKYNHSLTVHMQKHSGKFLLKCFFCNKGFSHPSILKRHLVSHSGKADYQCKYCSKKMQYASSLRLHEKMHFYRPSYTCDVCFKTFAYTNSLAEHKKTHEVSSGYVCGTCGREFMRKTSLRRHMAIHTVNKKPKFNFKIRLKPGTPKKGEKKQLKCDECSRKFRSKAVLIQHLKKHVGLHK